MKISRLFTIDVEMAEELSKSENQSSLINELLKDYFSISRKNKSELEQKQQILSKSKAKMKEIKREVAILKKLNDLNVDEHTIKWLLIHIEDEEFYENVDYGPYKRERNLKIPFKDILTAREVIKKHGDFFEKYK